MNRVDAILSELSSRHQNTDVRFLTAVRPMVERILDDGTPEAARVPLLEMLAETFERDVCMRRDLAIVREGFAAFFEDLKRRLGGR